MTLICTNLRKAFPTFWIVEFAAKWERNEICKKRIYKCFNEGLFLDYNNNNNNSSLKKRQKIMILEWKRVLRYRQSLEVVSTILHSYLSVLLYLQRDMRFLWKTKVSFRSVALQTATNESRNEPNMSISSLTNDILKKEAIAKSYFQDDIEIIDVILFTLEKTFFENSCSFQTLFFFCKSITLK
jgi:hypothetical protein